MAVAYSSKNRTKTFIFSPSSGSGRTVPQRVRTLRLHGLGRRKRSLLTSSVFFAYFSCKVLTIWLFLCIMDIRGFLLSSHERTESEPCGRPITRFPLPGFLSAYRIADFAEKRNCHNFIKVGKVLRHLVKYGGRFDKIWRKYLIIIENTCRILKKRPECPGRICPPRQSCRIPR